MSNFHLKRLLAVMQGDFCNITAAATVDNNPGARNLKRQRYNSWFWDSQTPGLPDSGTPRLQDSQTPGLPNPGTPGVPDSQGVLGLGSSQDGQQ